MDETWGKMIESFERPRGRSECLHPQASHAECSPKIVRAHTVPVSALKLIASNGHVMQLPKHPASLSKTGGRFDLLPVGIRRATTFTGFCGRHDNALFGPIEKEHLRACEEHAFLLIYRALCRELFAQEAAVQNARDLDENQWNTLDIGVPGLPLPVQFSSLEGHQDAAGDCVVRKRQLDVMLCTGQYTGVRFVFLMLERPPDIMCSGQTTPDFDFNGNQLQDVADWNTPLKSVFFSLIGRESRGWAVFSWLPEDENVAIPFVRSLLNRPSSAAIANGLARLVFSSVENSSFSPTWWNGLDATLKRDLLELNLLAVHPMQDNPPDYLAQGTDVLLNWSIDRIEANCGIEMPSWLKQSTIGD